MALKNEVRALNAMASLEIGPLERTSILIMVKLASIVGLHCSSSIGMVSGSVSMTDI